MLFRVLVLFCGIAVTTGCMSHHHHKPNNKTVYEKRSVSGKKAKKANKPKRGTGESNGTRTK